MLLWPFNKYPGTDYETFNWEWLIGIGKKMERALYDLFSDTGALHSMLNTVLGEHPEWVTTVMDGSITSNKIFPAFLKTITNWYITPDMYGAVGDGVTDDTDALKSTFGMPDNNNIRFVNLLGKSYYITDTLEVENCYIFNGKLIYNGPVDADIVILYQNSIVKYVDIDIIPATYNHNVFLIDYTKNDVQRDRNPYTIEDVYVKNNSGTFQSLSTVVRIHYNKYQILSGQKIRNLRFDGMTNYGIYIEPLLRDESDNPVYVDAIYDNIIFNAANCALKTLPSMDSGNVNNAKGEISIIVHGFSSQHTAISDKHVMDLHNTRITADLIDAWDYTNENAPSDGLYKTYKSFITMLNDHFYLAKKHNSDVVGIDNRLSTSERFTDLNTFKVLELEDDTPMRPNGANWSISNVKAIKFKPANNNPYNQHWIGLQLQIDNVIDPNGHVIQVGFNNAGTHMDYRLFDKSSSTWGNLHRVYSEGAMPTSYYDHRPDGLGTGDMKFDTTRKRPVWWDGTKWVYADGTDLT